MSGYRVRTIVMDGGERFPLLIGEDGIPLFRPTQWAVTSRRGSNSAANTLIANMYALKLLYIWSDAQKIDIEDRMLSGNYLLPHEISSLAASAKKNLRKMDGSEEKLPTKLRISISLEQARMKSPSAIQSVRQDTSANRLRTIADYLQWLGVQANLQLDLEKAALRKEALGGMIANLKAVTPKTRNRNVVGSREAPPQYVIDGLLNIIEPTHPDNPWADLGLQVRNKLLIHMLYGLGIRRGEALGIKIGDHIDLRGQKILIARNAD